jgi:hypothetical protein
MTTNRLAKSDGRTGKVTFESLTDYAARLNQQRWVDPNKPYFVNKRQDPDGFVTHFLDRNG